MHDFIQCQHFGEIQVDLLCLFTELRKMQFKLHPLGGINAT